jgi:hypothetical protein
MTRRGNYVLRPKSLDALIAKKAAEETIMRRCSAVLLVEQHR